MSITVDQAQSLSAGDGKVYTDSADKIGTIGQVYVDDTTGEPTWVTVKTGLFGSSESFVPLQGARVDGDDIIVGFDKETVKDAPRIDPDGSMTPQEENDLFTYYGLADSTGADHQPDRSGSDPDADPNMTPASSGSDDAVGDQDDDPQGHPGAVGHDTSGPTTDEAMTRSEERMNVGARTEQSGRARLRKYVTTENVTQTIPVRHEEVTLEREPITDDNRDASQAGPDISEEEHEVTLHQEVPVVATETVAVERVRLGKQTHTEDTTVSGDVRTENIEMDDDTAPTGGAAADGSPTSDSSATADQPR